MTEAERRLGYAFPPVFRRVYTEVADGGFGPSPCGFASVRHGNLLPGGHAWKTCEQVMEGHRAAGAPAGWHELIPGGCSLNWFTSVTERDNPVILYDHERWDPEDGKQPEDYIVRVVASLREWLWTWAEGGSVHDLVPPHAMLIDEPADGDVTVTASWRM